MKLRPDKTYFTGAVYAFGVLLFTVVWIMILLNGGSIVRGIGTLIAVCKPILYGFCFAYILYPLQRQLHSAFCRLLRRQARSRLCHALSVAVTFILLAAILTLAFAVVVPQIVSGYFDLENKISGYLTDSAQWLDNLFNDQLNLNFMLPTAPTVVKLPDTVPGVIPDLHYRTVEEAQQNGTLTAIRHTLANNTRISITDLLQKQLNGLYEYLSTLTPAILSLAVTIVTEAKNILIGLIISVYFLLSRERCLKTVRRFFTAVLPRRASGRFFSLVERLNSAFFRFVTDKIADSLVMFVLFLIFMTAFGFPYAPLVSTIMAISNLVPYLGPFFCSIPAVFIVFVAEPDMTLWFVLLLVLLQGADLYLIEVKLLGNRSMLSPAWVLIAVCVMGRLFGVTGLLVAVPLASVFYTRFKSGLSERLRKKNLPDETARYVKGKVPGKEVSAGKESL